ncbi:MAG: FGGY family carbohydrate kinase, partial [Armatimonadota bacterium]
MPQVVVIDCGSTNIRAIAVDEQGQIIASAGRPNEAVPQPGAPKGHIIWNLQQLWGKICDVCHEVAAHAPDVRAVTLTTWGADGAPVKEDGTLAYLPICWQDNRTEDIVKRIDDYLPAWDLYRLTGYQVIPFDTLLRFIWLREHQPAALEGTQWLMMPGLLSFMLCGEKSIERTAAGTMMTLDMAKEDWSPQLLGLAGLDASFFPRWVEPGDVIGHLTAQAAHDTG